MEAGRRAFLLGRGQQTKAPVKRPPWALAEAEFLARCSRCGDCIRACPTGLLRPDANQLPQADFLQAHCTFCGDCVTACLPHALTRENQARPWSLLAQINPSCLPLQGVLCRTCGEHCEPAAIRFTPRIGGPALPGVNAELCNGCGECVAVCPSHAIDMAPPSPTSLTSPQGN